MYNSGSELFYPVKDSCFVPALYCNLPESEKIMDRINNAYSLHWYGGHPASQGFNKRYTEKKANSSLDLISCILREKGII